MKTHKRTGTQIGIAISCLIFCVTCSCNPEPAPGTTDTASFETTPEKSPIRPGVIDEASGLVASKNLPGYLWTHQDSGGPASVYLLSVDGKKIKEYAIPGAANHDWEDIASGPGPSDGVNYLYISETGNNNAPVTSTNAVYRIPEISDTTSVFQKNQLEKITFSYPDGPRDAEALLVDPLTKDIYIISKEMNTGIYRLAYPQSTSSTITAEKLGTVPGIVIATGGDISPDGSEILIRTYLAVYYWKKKDGESLGQTLTKAATSQLNVELEPQGESVGFDKDAKGFYTLSERAKAASVTLNYYKRK